MSADKKQGIPANKITWSTTPTVDVWEHTSREIIPPQLSDQAKVAETTAELWQLFITEEMLDLMVQYTNEKIQEDLQQANHPIERLKNSTYIRTTDKVCLKQWIIF